MIQRLSAPSISFRANQLTSARDAYNAKVDNNLKTAQQQNDIISNTPAPSLNRPVPMQGQGQKLDIVA